MQRNCCEACCTCTKHANERLNGTAYKPEALQTATKAIEGSYIAWALMKTEVTSHHHSTTACMPTIAMLCPLHMHGGTCMTDYNTACAGQDAPTPQTTTCVSTPPPEGKHSTWLADAAWPSLMTLLTQRRAHIVLCSPRNIPSQNNTSAQKANTALL
jgi:hypothetical protein